MEQPRARMWSSDRLQSLTGPSSLVSVPTIHKHALAASLGAPTGPQTQTGTLTTVVR